MPTTAVNFSTCLLSIGVDLAGLLRGRGAWRAPKVGRCRVGWSMGMGVPSPANLGVWGSVVSSPSGVRGKAPAENGFWRISKATECSFLYLYDKIWGGGQFALVSPRSKFWGDLSPCPSPVIYAHAFFMLHSDYHDLQRLLPSPKTRHNLHQ